MDVKGPVKEATSTGKRTIDNAADNAQDTANTATKGVAAVTDNVQRAIDNP
jgi:hypothetical protein